MGKKWQYYVGWALLVIFCQIILICTQYNLWGSPLDYAVDPLEYLYGAAYHMPLATASVIRWNFNLVFFVAICLKEVERSRQENSFMSAVRYGSIRKYQAYVYFTLLLTILVYICAVYAGALVSYGIYARLGWKLCTKLSYVGMSFLLQLLFHLAFGVVTAFVIYHLDGLKLSLAIYPLLPAVCEVETNLCTLYNCIPGSFCMLGKSEIISADGYSVRLVIIIELVLFVVASVLFVGRKKR